MRMGKIESVRDLIAALEEAIEDSGFEDLPVRLAIQPNYPFAHSVGKVVTVEEGSDEDAPVVYVGEAGQLGYLDTPAAAALGWA